MALSSSLTTKVCANRKGSPRWIRCLRKQHAMAICAPLPTAPRRHQLQWTLRLRVFSRHFTRCRTEPCCAHFPRVRLERETPAYLPSQDKPSRRRTISRPRSTIFFPHKMHSRERICSTAEPFDSLTSSTTNGRDTIHGGNSLP